MELVDGGWGVHHEVDTRAVLREGDDVADVVDILEDHEDTVEAGSAAGVRRSAEFEGAQHTAKTRFDIGVVVAEDIEGFVHDVGVVITDGAGTDFITIHDHIVLVSFDGELVLIGLSVL